MGKKSKRIVLSIIIIFFLSLVSFAKGKTQHCSAKPIVKVKKITKSNLKKYKKFQGDFVFETANIISPVSGIITDIKISEGDIVSKGTILIVIDDNLSDKIKKVQAEIDKWKKILKKRQSWKERSERAETQAENKIKEQTALLKKIKNEAKKYSIKTTVNGKISSLKVNIGDPVEEGMIVADIINKKNMFSTIDIDKQSRKLFKDRKTIKIKDIDTGNTYDVSIKSISDDSVILYLNNEDFQIDKPFKFSFSILEKEYKGYIIISKDNIKEDLKGQYIFTIKGKKGFLGIVRKMIAKKTYIKVIDFYNDKYVLDKSSNVKENDYLIVAEINKQHKEIPINKSVCVRNGIVVKILQKNIKVKSQTITTKKVKKHKKRETKKPEKIKRLIKIKKPEVRKKIEAKEEKNNKPNKVAKKEVEKKKIIKKEFSFLTFVKKNKTLLRYSTLKSGYITYNKFKISLAGENLNIMSLISETLKYKYSFFQVEKKKNKMIYSAVFYKLKPLGEKIKPEFIKKEKKRTEKAKYDYAIRLSFGSYFTKSKEIDEITQFLTTKNISPAIKSNIFLLKPAIEFIYNLDRKKALILEFDYLLRKHDLTGKYSDSISNGSKSNYDYNPYDFNEKYLVIKGKFSFLVWENREKMNFRLNSGIGIYFGSITKTKTLNYSLTQNSQNIYSFNYNEDLNAKATGFLGFLGGELNFRLSEKIDFSASIGFDYFLKSNWSGTYTYNLPKDSTVDGDLYLVEYNKEKYLWILNEDKYNDLNKNKDYTLTKPVFSTGKINPRFSFGLIFKF